MNEQMDGWMNGCMDDFDYKKNGCDTIKRPGAW